MRPLRSERGVVAGAEGLAFGMLILLAGSLVVVNVWALVDTRSALDAASREYLRTYTEQLNSTEAERSGDLAARRSLEMRGMSSDGMHIDLDVPAGFGPCSLVTVRLATEVEWFKVPFLTGFGKTSLTVQNRELIDADSELITDDDYEPTATACFAN